MPCDPRGKVAGMARGISLGKDLLGNCQPKVQRPLQKLLEPTAYTGFTLTSGPKASPQKPKLGSGFSSENLGPVGFWIRVRASGHPATTQEPMSVTAQNNLNCGGETVPFFGRGVYVLA